MEIPNPEKLPRIESLTLSGLIKLKSQIKQLENDITKWKLKTLDLSHTSCLSGDSSALLSNSFPFLRSHVTFFFFFKKRPVFLYHCVNEKQKEWVITDPVYFLACHHLHNVKEKRTV